MKRVLVLALFALLAIPVFAVCTINVKSGGVDHGFMLTWDEVSGADQYYVDVSTDNFATSQRVALGPGATSFTFRRTNSMVITSYQTRVTAINDKNASFDPCVGTATPAIFFDQTFAKAVMRTVVPFVASLP